VSLHLISKKCPLCSKLSSGLKKLLSLFGFGLDCEGLNLRTYSSGERISEINSAAADCSCEKFRMSKHSPGVVENSENLALFVFLPMHNIDKNGKAKPNIFSHVHLKGRSVQRDTIASEAELVNFATNFLGDEAERVWKGVILAKCDDVRNIKLENSQNRSVCVYDTSEENNPAHAEIGQTQHIEEADKIELRHDLFVAFGNGNIIPPSTYKQGAIWQKLSIEHQSRL